MFAYFWTEVQLVSARNAKQSKQKNQKKISKKISNKEKQNKIKRK